MRWTRKERDTRKIREDEMRQTLLYKLRKIEQLRYDEKREILPKQDEIDEGDVGS